MNKLRQQLATVGLSEPQAFRYYLATAICSAVLYEIVANGPSSEPNPVDLLDAAMYFTFTIGGIIWCYRQNGGASGQDFRFVDSITFISIKKNKPGQALEIGKRITELIPAFKVTMMVDDDVDLWNPADLLMAFATRWQPHPASHIFKDMPALPLEPSSPVRERSAKIVIDATRQWPEEGGPKTYPAFSRQILEEHAPGIFDRVDAKWDVYGG